MCPLVCTGRPWKCSVAERSERAGNRPCASASPVTVPSPPRPSPSTSSEPLQALRPGSCLILLIQSLRASKACLPFPSEFASQFCCRLTGHLKTRRKNSEKGAEMACVTCQSLARGWTVTAPWSCGKSRHLSKRAQQYVFVDGDLELF